MSALMRLQKKWNHLSIQQLFLSGEQLRKVTKQTIHNEPISHYRHPYNIVIPEQDILQSTNRQVECIRKGHSYCNFESQRCKMLGDSNLNGYKGISINVSHMEYLVFGDSYQRQNKHTMIQNLKEPPVQFHKKKRSCELCKTKVFTIAGPTTSCDTCQFILPVKGNRLRNNALHLVLVRHGQSTNNTLADEILQQTGESPYLPGSEAERLYKKSASDDPGLTPKGHVQCAQLAENPYWFNAVFSRTEKSRVQLFSSPTRRAKETATYLANAWNAPLQIHPDLVEYENGFHDEPHPENKDHEETHQQYKTRLERLVTWIETMAKNHATRQHKGKDSVDTLVLVAHANMLGDLIGKLLRRSHIPPFNVMIQNAKIIHFECWKSPTAWEQAYNGFTIDQIENYPLSVRIHTINQ